jgi:hypothetical protein
MPSIVRMSMCIQIRLRCFNLDLRLLLEVTRSYVAKDAGAILLIFLYIFENLKLFLYILSPQLSFSSSKADSKSSRRTISSLADQFFCDGKLRSSKLTAIKTESFGKNLICIRLSSCCSSSF